MACWISFSQVIDCDIDQNVLLCYVLFFFFFSGPSTQNQKKQNKKKVATSKQTVSAYVQNSLL